MRNPDGPPNRAREAEPRRRVVLAATVLLATGAAWADSPAVEKGKLTEVAKELSDILCLTVQDKSLCLDRQHWDEAAKPKDAEAARKELIDRLIARGYPKQLAEREADRTSAAGGIANLWDRLRMAAGASGTAGSSVGRVARSSFTGQGLSATMVRGGEAFQLSVIEEERPGRTLQFRDDGAGSVGLAVVGSASGLAVVLSQAADGSVSLVAIDGLKVRRLQEASFAELYRRHGAYIHLELAPLLRQCGVAMAFSPADARTRAAVLTRLAGPLTKEERDEAARLIAQLSDAAYAKREEATKALSERFSRFQDALEQAKADSALPVEAAERLSAILAEHAETRTAGQVVTALNLTEDAPYLAGLLPALRGKERELVVAALERATGQKLGSDAGAWRAYLERQAESPAAGSQPGK